MNAINVIHPYKWNNMWVFDDESKELDKEPLIAGADTLITMLVEEAKKCSVMFSDKQFPDYSHLLTIVGPGVGDGTDYMCKLSKTYSHPVWLCPALLKYFNTPPEEIYFKIIDGNED
jgi:hypothetical protein